jgi:uncharacterized membrane protein
MDQLRGLPLGRQIVLGAGVLLLIDTFFDWWQVDVFATTVGQNAWHGFWGLIMCLALVVLLAWTVAKAFEIEIPVDLPDGVTSLGLSVLILVFAFIKTVSLSHTHWPAWLGVILAGAMTFGAWLIFDASGESLPSVGGSMGGNTGGSQPPE